MTIVGRDSHSKKQSIAYAKASFGNDHWSTAIDLGYRYYNAERGFWMYAREYEPITEENGIRYDRKRVKLRPFALITKSRDGKNTKTITADLAILDLSEPLGFNLNPDGEPLKIKHARLEGNVRVRDDKNTPNDPSDDMNVGPITTAEYDEPTQQIRTESYVVIQDPEMVATGDGMLIKLRKDDGRGQVHRPQDSTELRGLICSTMCTSWSTTSASRASCPGRRRAGALRRLPPAQALRPQHPQADQQQRRQSPSRRFHLISGATRRCRSSCPSRNYPR